MHYLIIIVTILIDQISKYYIQYTPALHGKVELIPNFLYVTYVKNTGVAWSMLSGKTVFLIIIGIIETAVLIYFLVMVLKAKNKPYIVALSLMIGGALGNLIDRIMFGYVRDFIDTYPFGYNFPVFNVADSALCIGVGIILILMIYEERKEKRNG